MRRAAPGHWLPPFWVALLAACCLARRAPAGNDAFTIRHEKTSKCLQIKDSWIVVADCKETKATLWKWVSQNRLFHLGSQKCLGLNIAKPELPLKMVNCDSQLMLWWRCVDASIFGASQYKLTLKDNFVTASINSSDTWRRSNSSEDICVYPYREIYTKDGNSYGRPCEFPFLVNQTWHHDCILDDTHTGGEWCATTYNYIKDGKWGICLKPEDGCSDNWEHDSGSESCYQLNTQSALSWKEAYISCQTQGGDLLSITNTNELSYIQAKDGISEKFWIGLNQLDISGGWQWSDHTPLNFLNWNPDMQNISPLDGSSCVAMNAISGQWQSYYCETALPYVCKKPLNNTKSELPDVWRYLETQCDSGWLPYSGFCYMLMNSQASWNMADQSCKANKSDLISMHSLADVELIVTKLHNETKEEIWTGFMNVDTPALFKWSDGSKVVFTYWDQNEPKIPFNSTPNCVSYSGKLGRWRVTSCEKKLKYVCTKKGKILNETISDKHCFIKEGWQRHGDFCYKIHNNKVSFGAQCNLTIMNRFEQEFINSLIGKYSKSEDKYFWTGLQDINHSGKYTWGDVDGRKNAVMYANWNSLQPAFPGGCVAMSSGKFLGKWEAKDCKTFTALSICKNYTGLPRQPEVLPKPTDPCPLGWKNGSGLACYKVFHKERVRRTRTWEEAERFCEALGGHLPSFSDITEMKELHSILRDIISNDRWVWVGLNKRNPDSLGTWEWSDNNPETTVLLHDFTRDDVRDCAALKTTRIRQRYFLRLYEDRQLDFYLKPFHCDARLEWVCQITKGTTPKIPDWYTPDVDGNHGQTFVVDGAEFWFVPDKHLSYQEAAFYCANNDSDLASVDSYTKLRVLLNKIDQLANAEQKWWLKYLDYGVNYRPHFQLFPRFSDRFWRDCWYISSRSWYRDYPINCHLKLPFICEKYNVSLLEKHEPEYHPPKGGCPKDWILFQNKCFLKIEHMFLKFKDANEKCETFGGTLPSISSQAEQDFLTSLLPGLEQNIWIGLQFKFSTKENQWVDGSRLLYSNFHPLLRGRLRKVPLDLFDEEVNNQCGVMLNNPNSLYAGTWNFFPCAHEHFLGFCQKQAGPADNQTQEVLNETLTYQNVHYTLILKNVSWYDALQECKQKNMQLVSITDQYQQAFLAVQAAIHNYPLWIGLFSKDDGKHYTWADGKNINFSRWSEEDDKTSEECVFLDVDGFWKTFECSSENPGAICYLPRNNTEKEQIAEQIKCPHKFKNTPWISFQNSCYTFMITKDRWQEMKSQEAHHLCKKINPDAYVLNIRNEEENNFVVEQLHSFSGLATWVWLGVIYDDSDNLLKWYDETPLFYNNWSQGRPNVKKNQFFAGVNLDGFWDIYNRTLSWQALQFNQHSILSCKIEMGSRESRPPLPKSISHGNSTYRILQKKITWYEALRECKQNGSDLVSIHSESQQLFLEDIVKRDGYPLWLGLSSHGGNESDLEWSDGSEFDYCPWELENAVSSGNCVVLDTKGFWKYARCTNVVEGAICYTTSDHRRLQPQQTKGSSRCPQGTGTSQWLQYKDHCYAFDMALYNFSVYTAEEAERICQKLDPSATLLTIKDAEENTFVSRQIRQNDLITRRVWLGLSQNLRAKSMNWLDGSTVEYANWANGTAKVNGKCSVILSTDGIWSEVDCSHGKGRVVCKAPLGTNHTGVAVAFALLIILVLVAGLTWYLYKKKRLRWGAFSAVHYERGINEDETDSMFTKDGY